MSGLRSLPPKAEASGDRTEGRNSRL